VGGINDVRVNLEAGPGVTGYMVEKALNSLTYLLYVELKAKIGILYIINQWAEEIDSNS
jgi:hypothetical protein